MRPESTVAEIALDAPATIGVFQRYQIDFCCGGRIPLGEACRNRGLDVDVILGELRSAVAPPAPERDWTGASLTALVEHLQRRYHDPLRHELSRLSAMLQRVVTRHGDRLPGQLLPLQRSFDRIREGLLTHVNQEDRILFPAIAALEARAVPWDTDIAALISQPIAAVAAGHAAVGLTLSSMRETTGGYAPPDWACATFRGLYYGMARLETDLHVHVHLENDVLFPRAEHLARRYRLVPGAG